MLITIAFNFSRDDENRTEFMEFDATESLVSDCDDYADDLISDWDDDGDEGWTLDEYEVHEYDMEYAAPADFDDLEEYGKYADCVEEHGWAYHARWEDIGEFEFHDEYNGEWNSEREFACQLFEDCYDIPDFISGYIDWDCVARDVMMDYDSYRDADGQYHIFRNC